MKKKRHNALVSNYVVLILRVNLCYAGEFHSPAFVGKFKLCYSEVGHPIFSDFNDDSLGGKRRKTSRRCLVERNSFPFFILGFG